MKASIVVRVRSVWNLMTAGAGKSLCPMVLILALDAPQVLASWWTLWQGVQPVPVVQEQVKTRQGAAGAAIAQERKRKAHACGARNAVRVMAK